MDLTDPFSFTRPRYSKKEEELVKVGGFRLFNSNFIGPKWTGGEVAPDDIDLQTAYKYINTPAKSIPDRIAKIHDFYYYLAQSPEDLKKADQYVIDAVDKLYGQMSFTERIQASTMKKAFQVKLLTGVGYSNFKFSKLDKETKDTLSNYNTTELERDNISVESVDIPDSVKDLLPPELRLSVDKVGEVLQPFKRYIKDLIPSLQELDDRKLYEKIIQGEKRETPFKLQMRTNVVEEPEASRETELQRQLRITDLRQRVRTLDYLLELDKIKEQEEQEDINNLTRINFLEL